jgi:hypothetical protein
VVSIGAADHRGTAQAKASMHTDRSRMREVYTTSRNQR